MKVAAKTHNHYSKNNHQNQNHNKNTSTLYSNQSDGNSLDTKLQKSAVKHQIQSKGIPAQSFEMIDDGSAEDFIHPQIIDIQKQETNYGHMNEQNQDENQQQTTIYAQEEELNDHGKKGQQGSQLSHITSVMVRDSLDSQNIINSWQQHQVKLLVNTHQPGTGQVNTNTSGQNQIQYQNSKSSLSPRKSPKAQQVILQDKSKQSLCKQRSPKFSKQDLSRGSSGSRTQMPSNRNQSKQHHKIPQQYSSRYLMQKKKSNQKVNKSNRNSGSLNTSLDLKVVSNQYQNSSGRILTLANQVNVNSNELMEQANQLITHHKELKPRGSKTQINYNIHQPYYQNQSQFPFQYNSQSNNSQTAQFMATNAANYQQQILLQQQKSNIIDGVNVVNIMQQQSSTSNHQRSGQIGYNTTHVNSNNDLQHPNEGVLHNSVYDGTIKNYQFQQASNGGSMFNSNQQIQVIKEQNNTDKKGSPQKQIYIQDGSNIEFNSSFYKNVNKKGPQKKFSQNSPPNAAQLILQQQNSAIQEQNPNHETTPKNQQTNQKGNKVSGSQAKANYWVYPPQQIFQQHSSLTQNQSPRLAILTKNVKLQKAVQKQDAATSASITPTRQQKEQPNIRFDEVTEDHPVVNQQETMQRQESKKNYIELKQKKFENKMKFQNSNPFVMMMKSNNGLQGSQIQTEHSNQKLRESQKYSQQQQQDLTKSQPNRDTIIIKNDLTSKQFNESVGTTRNMQPSQMSNMMPESINILELNLDDSLRKIPQLTQITGRDHEMPSPLRMMNQMMEYGSATTNHAKIQQLQNNQEKFQANKQKRDSTSMVGPLVKNQDYLAQLPLTTTQKLIPNLGAYQVPVNQNKQVSSQGTTILNYEEPYERSISVARKYQNPQHLFSPKKKGSQQVDQLQQSMQKLEVKLLQDQSNPKDNLPSNSNKQNNPEQQSTTKEYLKQDNANSTISRLLIATKSNNNNQTQYKTFRNHQQTNKEQKVAQVYPMDVLSQEQQIAQEQQLQSQVSPKLIQKNYKKHSQQNMSQLSKKQMQQDIKNMSIYSQVPNNQYHNASQLPTALQDKITSGLYTQSNSKHILTKTNNNFNFNNTLAMNQHPSQNLNSPSKKITQHFSSLVQQQHQMSGSQLSLYHHNNHPAASIHNYYNQQSRLNDMLSKDSVVNRFKNKNTSGGIDQQIVNTAIGWGGQQTSHNVSSQMRKGSMGANFNNKFNNTVSDVPSLIMGKQKVKSQRKRNPSYVTQHNQTGVVKRDQAMQQTTNISPQHTTQNEDIINESVLSNKQEDAKDKTPKKGKKLHKHESGNDKDQEEDLDNISSPSKSRILLSKKKKNTNRLHAEFEPLIDTTNKDQQKMYLELHKQQSSSIEQDVGSTIYRQSPRINMTSFQSKNNSLTKNSFNPKNNQNQTAMFPPLLKNQTQYNPKSTSGPARYNFNSSSTSNHTAQKMLKQHAIKQRQKSMEKILEDSCEKLYNSNKQPIKDVVIRRGSVSKEGKEYSENVKVQDNELQAQQMQQTTVGNNSNESSVLGDDQKQNEKGKLNQTTDLNETLPLSKNVLQNQHLQNQAVSAAHVQSTSIQSKTYESQHQQQTMTQGVAASAILSNHSSFGTLEKYRNQIEQGILIDTKLNKALIHVPPKKKYIKMQRDSEQYKKTQEILFFQHKKTTFEDDHSINQNRKAKELGIPDISNTLANLIKNPNTQLTSDVQSPLVASSIHHKTSMDNRYNSVSFNNQLLSPKLNPNQPFISGQNMASPQGILQNQQIQNYSSQIGKYQDVSPKQGVQSRKGDLNLLMGKKVQIVHKQPSISQIN